MRASGARSRAITASDEIPRWASGLSWIVSWPRLREENPLETPTVEPTLAIAGSCNSTSTTCFCRADIALKEMSGEARVEPWISPVSSIGRKPLGTTV